MKSNVPLTVIIVLSMFVLGSMKLSNFQEDDWDVPSKYEKMKNTFVDVEDEDQIGRELYAIHCKSCHGSKGKGDGSKSKELSTPVPDITIAAFKSQSDGAIYYKTYIGREDMPGFSKKIKDEEDQWMLVNYIKGF